MTTHRYHPKYGESRQALYDDCDRCTEHAAAFKAGAAALDPERVIEIYQKGIAKRSALSTPEEAVFAEIQRVVRMRDYLEVLELGYGIRFDQQGAGE